MDDLINKFLYLLRFVPYVKEEKVKMKRLLSSLPQSYKERIEFDNPKSLNEVFGKTQMFYDQYKQRSEILKAWKDKKQDRMNQRNKGFQPTPFHNMEKKIVKEELSFKHLERSRGR